MRTVTRPRRSRCRWAAIALLPLLLAVPAGAGEIEDRIRGHLDRAAEDGLTPEDFHHLALAFFWRGTSTEPELIERGLDRLGATARVDPLMADELRLLRARLAVEEGRAAAARELYRAMGGLTEWWVRGPEAVGELEDFDGLTRLPGDDGWRPAPGTDPLGWVRIAGLAWPAQRQLVYLATTVEADREQPVAVRLGAAEVARVWLNGRQLLTTPHPLERAEDQFAAGGWLARGANTVVVAVASESDDWWLRLRLTAPDGRPLDGVREIASRPGSPAGPDRPSPRVRDLESEIRDAVRAGRDRARTALAAYLVLRRPQAVGAGDARSACRAARAEAPGEARLLEWLLGGDPTAVHELLRDAIAAEPDLSWARLELATWYAERALYEEAATVLEPALGEPAARALALDLDSDLWGMVVLPRLVELARRHPGCETAAVAAAHRAIDARRTDLAAEIVARLGAKIPLSPVVVELEERLAEACNDGAALLELLSDGLEADPNNPWNRLRLARMLNGLGDVDGARRRLEEGLERAPGNVELMMELARVEHAAGADERALELSRQVLVLRPQDRRAWRLAELLGGETEDLSWMRPVDELWRLAAEAPEGDPAVVVLNHVEVHFLPSQLTEERVQRVFKITAAERADAYRRQTLPWVAESQRLRVLAARVLRPDGSELSARQGDTPRLAEPEFNLYYDTRLRVLDLPELADGDLVEIAYILTETIESNETGPYKGGLVSLGRPVPTALAEVELVGADGALPRVGLVNLEGEPSRSETADGTVRLSWSWRDLPAIPHDVPPAPPFTVGGYVTYSNHPDWGDLGAWYERHVAPRVRPSRQVEELAEELTAGVDDRLDRIARIYSFVTNEIRYVGLEFGEHRFRPFAADWVLSHRIGDCKDKAALLVALFDAVGIPARMVMVRTADLGPVAGDLALLELFNHAIAYLPEDDLWLDGTASGHALMPPPTMDQGATVLVVEGERSRPAVTPRRGGGIASSRVVIGPAVDGMVPVRVRTEDTGEAAVLRRVRFAGSQDPRPFATWLQGWFPGAELTAEPVTRLIPSRDPAVVELEAVVPRTALASRGGLPVYPGSFDWPARVAPTRQRFGPLLVGVRPDLKWSLEVELGRPPRELPDGVRLAGDHGELRVDIEATDAGYRVEGYLHLEPGLVAADDVPGLRDFLLEVERRLGRLLEVP